MLKTLSVTERTLDKIGARVIQRFELIISWIINNSPEI